MTERDTPAVVEPLVVRRSTLRTWLIALAGIPAIVVGIDVVWRRRIVAWLTERIFPTDPQLLEFRDEIWAWALVVVGGAVVGWGLKELFDPAPVLRTDDEGVHIRMLGPFRPVTTLPWDSLHDVDAGLLEDDGDPLEVLVIEVKDGTLLPVNPWAGRRFDDHTLALYSLEWDKPADDVAEKLADQALAVARATRPEA
jgi:hypothetical protein